MYGNVHEISILMPSPYLTLTPASVWPRAHHFESTFFSALIIHSFLFSPSFPTSLPPRSLTRFVHCFARLGIFHAIFQRATTFILARQQKDPCLEFLKPGFDSLRRPGERV